MDKTAVVVGAGVGGLTAAIALQRRGWHVTVYERATALEAVGAGIAIAPNALRALDTLDLADRVKALAALQGEAGIRRADGRWLSRTSAEAAEVRYGNPTVVLHRAELINLLAGALAAGTVRLGTAVDSVDPDSGGVTTSAGDVPADLVVAADGINSSIRRRLFPDHPGLAYAGVTSWRIVTEPSTSPILASETWGGGQVFGTAVLADGRIYCYATAVTPPGERATDEKGELTRRFGSWHEPIPELIARADPAQILRTDIHRLATPLDRFHDGRIALLGDAAHAMTPNLGQGGCQAIEDAVVLAHHADKAPNGLAAYTRERLPRTTRVATQSYRLTRLTRLSPPVTAAVRDGAIWLAGRLGPNVVLRQMDPVFAWHPPQPTKTGN